MANNLLTQNNLCQINPSSDGVNTQLAGAFNIMEEWRDVPGFSNYKVSSLGRVKSLSRMINAKLGSKRSIPERILKQTLDRNGYYIVGIYKEVNNGNPKLFFVHRLVAISFLPNPLNLPTVNHIDLNTQNNHLDNLEWASNRYQMEHRLLRGVMGISKLTIEQVIIIKTMLLEGKPTMEISSMFPFVTELSIKKIANNQTWAFVKPKP